MIELDDKGEIFPFVSMFLHFFPTAVLTFYINYFNLFPAEPCSSLVSLSSKTVNPYLAEEVRNRIRYEILVASRWLLNIMALQTVHSCQDNQLLDITLWGIKYCVHSIPDSDQAIPAIGFNDMIVENHP